MRYVVILSGCFRTKHFQSIHLACKSRHMKQYIFDSSIKIFACESGGEKVGLLALNQLICRNEIKGIVISENHRCHGIGKLMIYQVVESGQARIGVFLT